MTNLYKHFALGSLFSLGIISAQAIPFNLPVTIQPTEEDMANIIVTDVNGDGKTWAKNDVQGIEYTYHTTNDANDWFFIPVNVDADTRVLKVDFYGRGNSTNYTEKLEFAIGTQATPEGMTALQQYEFKSNVPTLLSNFVNVPENDGIIYLGFHAQSPANAYNMYVKDISISKFSSPEPLPPTLTSSNIEYTHYTAAISIPSIDRLGNPLNSTLTLSAKVDDVEDAYTYNVTPGSVQNVDLTLTKGDRVIEYTLSQVVDETTYTSSSIQDNVRAERLPGDYIIPFDIELTQEIFDSEFTVIDANEDGTTWYFDETLTEPVVTYKYHTINQANDWLILPAFNSGYSDRIKISLEASCNTINPYDESFDICIGTSKEIADMSVLLEERDLKIGSFQEYVIETDLDQTNTSYYIAIHCVSTANMNTLHFKNFAVTSLHEVDPETGIAAVETEGSVIAANGEININGFAGKEAMIYALDGTTIAHFNTLNDANSVNVAPGIYIVKVANKSFKVLVK